MASYRKIIMKMSRSESGKLGALKSAEFSHNFKKSNILKYNTNPKKCINDSCGKVIDYDNRFNKFCSKSCSAKYNNKKRKVIKNKCKNCNNLISTTKQYCGNKCFNEYRFKEIIYKKFQQGEIYVRLTLKHCLLVTHEYKCFKCGLIEWMGKKLSLELNHIDGDSSNNFPNNLELICPNCHSVTESWKGRNKGNGRKSKGIPLY